MFIDIPKQCNCYLAILIQTSLMNYRVGKAHKYLHLQLLSESVGCLVLLFGCLLVLYVWFASYHQIIGLEYNLKF